MAFRRFKLADGAVSFCVCGVADEHASATRTRFCIGAGRHPIDRVASEPATGST